MGGRLCCSSVFLLSSLPLSWQLQPPLLLTCPAALLCTHPPSLVSHPLLLRPSNPTRLHCTALHCTALHCRYLVTGKHVGDLIKLDVLRKGQEMELEVGAAAAAVHAVQPFPAWRSVGKALARPSLLLTCPEWYACLLASVHAQFKCLPIAPAVPALHRWS